MYDELGGGYSKKDFLGFIKKNRIMVLSVEDQDWPVQATTVFYAVENDDCILIKSHTTSHHGSVIRSGGKKVVATIFDLNSTYTNKAGVQMRGICERIFEPAEMRNAVKIYSDTFEGAAARFAPIDELVSENAKSTLFRIRLVSGKMLSPEGYSPDFQELWER